MQIMHYGRVPQIKQVLVFTPVAGPVRAAVHGRAQLTRARRTCCDDQLYCPIPQAPIQVLRQQIGAKGHEGCLC